MLKFTLHHLNFTNYIITIKKIIIKNQNNKY